jgi:hypothetical protein
MPALDGAFAGPEVPGAVVFGVGSPREMLVQTFRPPWTVETLKTQGAVFSA